MPRHLPAARRLGDFQPHTLKNLVGRKTGLEKLLGQRLCIGAIGWLRRRRECAGCSVHRQEGICRRLHQGQSGRKRFVAAAIGPLIGKVHDSDFDLAGHASQRIDQIGHTDGIQRQITGTIDLRARGNDVVFPIILDAISSHVDSCNTVGTRFGHLTEKLAIFGAQGVLVQISHTGDFKPGRTERFRDQACIVGRRCQRAICVGVVTDDEREAVGLGSCGRSTLRRVGIVVRRLWLVLCRSREQEAGKGKHKARKEHPRACLHCPVDSQFGLQERLPSTKQPERLS